MQDTCVRLLHICASVITCAHTKKIKLWILSVFNTQPQILFSGKGELISDYFSYQDKCSFGSFISINWTELKQASTRPPSRSRSRRRWMKAWRSWLPSASRWSWATVRLCSTAPPLHCAPKWCLSTPACWPRWVWMPSWGSSTQRPRPVSTSATSASSRSSGEWRLMISCFGFESCLSCLTRGVGVFQRNHRWLWAGGWSGSDPEGGEQRTVPRRESQDRLDAVLPVSSEDWCMYSLPLGY